MKTKSLKKEIISIGNYTVSIKDGIIQTISYNTFREGGINWNIKFNNQESLIYELMIMSIDKLHRYPEILDKAINDKLPSMVEMKKIVSDYMIDRINNKIKYKKSQIEKCNNDITRYETEKLKYERQD